jgi:aminoglycoside 6'-N-acetyltransferase
MIIQKDNLTIRKMLDCREDYELMAKWLSDKRVLKYYGGRNNPFDLEKIIEKYSPRVLGKDKVIPCIVEFDKKPIGYIQYYELNENDKNEYELSTIERTYGIDLFIGETRYWNQGIGSLLIKAILEYLFQKERAEKVVVDPATKNQRAIRCNEKCGFRKVKLLPKHELNEGIYIDCWLMEIIRK